MSTTSLFGNSEASLSSNIIPISHHLSTRPTPSVNASNKNPFEGVLSRGLWEKAHRVPSRFVDRFDYSTYDKLHQRFGENQPRGGVIYKTALKLANHHSGCTKCHYAFELDTYGRGCVHNCSYCYAKDQLTQHAMWNQPFPFPFDYSELRKIFATVFETTKTSRWRPILEKRIPIRIGSMSDSFMWLDKKYRITYETLRLLNFYKYPYVIFTRSDLVSNDEYLTLLDPQLASVQFSISGMNEEYTRLLEPGAPSPKRRFSALKALSNANIRTAIRLNPLFPKYPDGYFTKREMVEERFGGASKVPTFNFFDIDKAGEFIDQVSETNTPTLLAGVVRLSGYSINSISKATQVNIKSFFTPGQFKGNEDRHFSDSEVAYYYKKLQAECVRRGVRFSTCYIGNGLKDYYQYQSLWANKQDCCDIKGFVKPFERTSQDISWDTRLSFAVHKDAANNARIADSEAERSYASPGLTTKQYSDEASSIGQSGISNSLIER